MKNKTFQWAIIGAGPAGIAAVGKLIDIGIKPNEIIWIDPEFTVGNFGTLWQRVPSNTKVNLFNQFLHAAKSFHYQDCEKKFALHDIDPADTCELGYMAAPLQWVTDHLKTNVNVEYGFVESLQLRERCWQLRMGQQMIKAKNALLAIGAEPKSLHLNGVQELHLADVIDASRIKSHLNNNDVVGVFGSSHSAILAIRLLLENGAKKVINFYLEPLRFAVYMQDWILFDDSGLKGTTADWARKFIDGTMPPNLERYYSNKDNIATYLPQCNKVVYAIGFERRTKPKIIGFETISYNDNSGIIAPGLFGLGIAFPEGKVNPIGMLEYRVGLWKFMEYLDRVIPLWLQYGA